MPEGQDAHGHAMRDYFEGKGGYEKAERDDGHFDTSPGPALYFSEYEEWGIEKEAMRYVTGRVLDIGCGAGRHALYLQDQGLDVVGIDSSPPAIEVRTARGLTSTQVLSVTQATRRLGVCYTILMLGNSFGLVGSPMRARWLLTRFHKMTSETGRIVAGTRDPYGTEAPEHL